MIAEPIRKLLHAVPFAPFSVQLANGRSLRIPHADFALLTQGGRTMIVHTEGEDFDIVDVLLVTNVHVERGETPAASQS